MGPGGDGSHSGEADTGDGLRLVGVEDGGRGMRVDQSAAPANIAPMSKPLSHLDLLEAESIHIFREAAAEFRKPVLMYSIGKD